MGVTAGASALTCWCAGDRTHPRTGADHVAELPHGVEERVRFSLPPGCASGTRVSFSFVELR